MVVDKNLFLHDLSIVLISKSEGLYLKEWLDYHLLAGVDHFYLYDNETPGNIAEIVEPYIKAGLVDYIPAPGKVFQVRIYNEAFKHFRFQTRYMAFLDGDEFIYPKSSGGGCITDVVDEIFSDVPEAGELGISWQCFGSNGQEKADYSRGVLERFTMRESNDVNPHTWCKFVSNPRTISFMDSPHCAFHFEGFVAINTQREVKSYPPWHINPPLTDKIVINHYHTKSHEEYRIRKSFFLSPGESFSKFEKHFEEYDRNEIFDDGILKYRAVRAKVFKLPDKSRSDERVFNALVANLSPTLMPTTPPEFYAGKMETFLTCRAVAAYLQTKLTDNAPAKFFEEASIKAILRTLASGGMNFADVRLLLTELPELLKLPYPVVEDLRKACIQLIPQLEEPFHAINHWSEIVELEYIQRLLQAWRPQ